MKGYNTSNGYMGYVEGKAHSSSMARNILPCRIKKQKKIPVIISHLLSLVMEC